MASNNSDGILRGREANVSQYRVCNFKKEQMPLYAKTLYYLLRENYELAKLIHFKPVAYYRPYKGNGRDANVTINLPNHFSMWVDGTESNLVNMSQFWKVMHRIKERIDEGAIHLEPYIGFISSKTITSYKYRSLYEDVINGGIVE